ncbi:MAG: ATP-binding cassette domain-containing protein [Actinomycetota bacterium]
MTGQPAVAARGLVCQFGPVRAVDDLSFEVAEGEVFGLLGPNGAGKTTVIRVVTTLLKPAAGTVRVFGLDTRRSTMRVRRRIGYLPQQLSIDGQLTGYENVWLFARLFDVPRRERRGRVEDALAQVGLEKVGRRLASTYSGGMVRRLELAQALVSRPRLLVLDEPTIGLDPLARDSIGERVLGLRAEEDMTVLLTTHYMEEAEQLCDRVGLLLNGRLRAIGRPRELEAALGPGATLEDVFRAYAAGGADEDKGGQRDVRSTRRTAGRLR